MDRQCITLEAVGDTGEIKSMFESLGFSLFVPIDHEQRLSILISVSQ